MRTTTLQLYKYHFYFDLTANSLEILLKYTDVFSNRSTALINYASILVESEHLFSHALIHPGLLVTWAELADITCNPRIALKSGKSFSDWNIRCTPTWLWREFCILKHMFIIHCLHYVLKVIPSNTLNCLPHLLSLYIFNLFLKPCNT